MAVQYEKAAYMAADMHDANVALLHKAACLKQAGEYYRASEALSRIRMYALEGDEMAEVLYQKELCSYLSGDFPSAASYMDEARENGAALDSHDKMLLDVLVLNENRRWEEARQCAVALVEATVWDDASKAGVLLEIDRIYRRAPKEKSRNKAFILSFIPPFGHMYSHAYGEGVLSFGLNVAAVSFGVVQAMSGCWITAFAGGATALYTTFTGNQERCQKLVDVYNSQSVREFNDELREWLAGVTD